MRYCIATRNDEGLIHQTGSWGTKASAERNARREREIAATSRFRKEYTFTVVQQDDAIWGIYRENNAAIRAVQRAEEDRASTPTAVYYGAQRLLATG